MRRGNPRCPQAKPGPVSRVPHLIPSAVQRLSVSKEANSKDKNPGRFTSVFPEHSLAKGLAGYIPSEDLSNGGRSAASPSRCTDMTDNQPILTTELLNDLVQGFVLSMNPQKF